MPLLDVVSTLSSRFALWRARRRRAVGDDATEALTRLLRGTPDDMLYVEALDLMETAFDDGRRRIAIASCALIACGMVVGIASSTMAIPAFVGTFAGVVCLINPNDCMTGLVVWGPRHAIVCAHDETMQHACVRRAVSLAKALDSQTKNYSMVEATVA